MAGSIRGTIVLLLCLVVLVAAWSKEDHEIFRLRDEVASHEGSNATFYSFIGVKPSANLDEINKAYRKTSRQLHPDKARQSFIANYNTPAKASSKASSSKAKPTVHVTKNKQPSSRELATANKIASERFARLGLVATILRGPERSRYDHFLANGFPAWRGTGYYYARYRPGLGAVLLGLFVVVGGGAHYTALYLNWKKQREFVERYIRHARRAAWGDETGVGAIPGLEMNGGSAAVPPPAPAAAAQEDEAQNWNRREKRAREKETRRASKNSKAVAKARKEGISTPVEAEVISGPVGAKKRTIAPNGKVLIVDSTGNVYLEEETEEGDVHEFLLDVDEIPPPTIYDTVLFRLPKWLYNQSVGKALGQRTLDAEVADLIDDNENEDVADDEVALQAATSANANGEARKRRSKARG